MPQLTLDSPIDRVFAPAALPAAEVEGLYVHVPFCFHKCHYCDFYSITRQNEQRMGRFVERVLAEAAGWADRAGNGESGARGPVVRPRTVFFGGGTPSVLPMVHMQRLIAGLRERIDCTMVGEWTVEVNPATATLEYCRMLRERGV